jgi:predicted  nucleic acid-binding Zn-ribbon protein
MDEINLDMKKNEMLQLDEINRLKKSLDESMNSNKGSEQKLMVRVKELNDQLVNKDQTNLKLTNDMNVLQLNLNDYSQQNIQLEQTLEDYRNRTESIAQGSSELQNMMLEKDTQIKKYMNELKTVKEEKNKLSISLSKSEENNSVLQQTIKDLESKISDMQNNLESKDDQLNQTIDE